MSIDRKKMKPAMLAVFEDLFQEIGLVKKDVDWLKKQYWTIISLLCSDLGLALWRMLHP